MSENVRERTYNLDGIAAKLYKNEEVAESNDESFLVRPGGKEKDMGILFLLMPAFVVLAVAAYRWGANSSDGVNSCEWERRQRWFVFH